MFASEEDVRTHLSGKQVARKTEEYEEEDEEGILRRKRVLRKKAVFSPSSEPAGKKKTKIRQTVESSLLKTSNVQHSLKTTRRQKEDDVNSEKENDDEDEDLSPLDLIMKAKRRKSHQEFDKRDALALSSALRVRKI